MTDFVETALRQSKTQRLARAILADRNRPTTHHNIVACFSCGRSFPYRGRQGELNGRFCSMRCQDWYDAGNPSYDQQQQPIIYRWRDGRPMRAGRQGFFIDCANCKKEFESKGLRCCSTECEKAYRRREENLAIMAKVGMEAETKRKCAGPGCEATIPKWNEAVSDRKRVRK